MSSEVGLLPIIFAFSILLVFLHRFYRRYMRQCLVRGSKQRVLRGASLIMLSVSGSILLRFYGF